MKIKATLTIGAASLLLAACSTMDSQNTAKVTPAKMTPAKVTHTHPENCKYNAVTHTHGDELGGTSAATHNHGRGC